MTEITVVTSCLSDWLSVGLSNCFCDGHGSNVCLSQCMSSRHTVYMYSVLSLYPGIPPQILLRKIVRKTCCDFPCGNGAAMTTLEALVAQCVLLDGKLSWSCLCLVPQLKHRQLHDRQEFCDMVTGSGAISHKKSFLGCLSPKLRNKMWDGKPGF